MAFAKALLDGQASTLQLAALVRALVAPYELMEQQVPEAAAGSGPAGTPSPDGLFLCALRRRPLGRPAVGQAGQRNP